MPPPPDLDDTMASVTLAPDTMAPDTMTRDTEHDLFAVPPLDQDDPLVLLEGQREKARSLATIRNELTVGAATIAIAVAALKEAAAILRAIRTSLVAAAAPRADRAAIQRDIASANVRLWELAVAASVNGTNLLVAPRPPKASKDITIVAALARGRSGEITISAIDIDRSITALFGEAPRGEPGARGVIDRPHDGTGGGLAELDVSSLSDRAEHRALLDRFVLRVDTAIIGVTAGLSHLSIARSRINLQASFIAALSDAAAAEEPAAPFESALDHDSALRTARETRTLLMKQSHGIARLNSQTVLKLFRGS
jgi:flagellin